MSSWITDHELFLYTKESDAYLWRCKKTSRVPMMPEDFEDLGKVTNHFDLVGDIFEWEIADYNALVAYISSRRLLVNGQGLVIVELYKFGHDGNIDPSQRLPCCYIRSLDVLNMKTYIPNLRERLIPCRTVQYLEEDGRAARVRDDASIERKAKEVLEKEVSNLKAANETLKVSITKLTVDLEVRKLAAIKAEKEAECMGEFAALQAKEHMREIAAIKAKDEEAENNNYYHVDDDDEFSMYGNGI